MATLHPTALAIAPPLTILQDFPGESRSRAVIITTITITAFMAVLVILRIFSRLWYAKSMRSDDCKLLLVETQSLMY